MLALSGETRGTSMLRVVACCGPTTATTTVMTSQSNVDDVAWRVDRSTVYTVVDETSERLRATTTKHEINSKSTSTTATTKTTTTFDNNDALQRIGGLDTALNEVFIVSIVNCALLFLS